MSEINKTSNIEYREFIAAFCTVAVVIGDRIWNSSVGPAIIERPETKPRGSLSTAEAAEHVGLGRTAFYKLAKEEPQFPKAIEVKGRKRYRVKDLDRWLASRPGWVAQQKPNPRS